MPTMKNKIKVLFNYILSSCRDWYGRFGLIFIIISIILLIRLLFFGNTNFIKYVSNIWKLKHLTNDLVLAEKNLEDISKHIELIEKRSPDYIEELSIKYLNMSEPKARILRF